MKLPLLLSTILFALPVSAHADGKISYGNGKSVGISADWGDKMQCVINTLEHKEGKGEGFPQYDPKDVGCFAERPKNRSAHPTGHACDVDQTGRNETKLNVISSADQQKLAESCEVVSGCKWRNPDCGHFEMRSAPYSAAGAPVDGGSHVYGGKRSVGRR